MPEGLGRWIAYPLDLHVTSIARLTDLLDYLALHKGSTGEQAEFKTAYDAVLAYRQRYGVEAA